MKKLFHNYKRDYEMALQVMGAMVDEIIRLREQNENLLKEKHSLATGNIELQKDNQFLAEENGDYDEILVEQNKTIACLHDKIRRAADILTK